MVKGCYHSQHNSLTCPPLLAALSQVAALSTLAKVLDSAAVRRLDLSGCNIIMGEGCLWLERPTATQRHKRTPARLTFTSIHKWAHAHTHAHNTPHCMQAEGRALTGWATCCSTWGLQVGAEAGVSVEMATSCEL